MYRWVVFKATGLDECLWEDFGWAKVHGLSPGSLQCSEVREINLVGEEAEQKFFLCKLEFQRRLW